MKETNEQMKSLASILERDVDQQLQSESEDVVGEARQLLQVGREVLARERREAIQVRLEHVLSALAFVLAFVRCGCVHQIVYSVEDAVAPVFLRSPHDEVNDLALVLHYLDVIERSNFSEESVGEEKREHLLDVLVF